MHVPEAVNSVVGTSLKKNIKYIDDSGLRSKKKPTGPNTKYCLGVARKNNAF